MTSVADTAGQAPDPRSVLRAATQDRHERLDQSLVIGGAEAGYADYIVYVAALRGWLAPVEEAVWNRPWPEELLAARRRGKVAWIDADLQAARAAAVAVPALPTCTRLPAGLQDDAYALGVAYVIEGSQLGGRMMAKRLQRDFPQHAFRYMEGYGADLGALWKRFIEFLPSQLRDADALDRAVAGARDAFDSLSDWLALCGRTGVPATAAAGATASALASAPSSASATASAIASASASASATASAPSSSGTAPTSETP